MSAFIAKVKSIASAIIAKIAPIASAILAKLPSLSDSALILLGVLIGYVMHPFIKLALGIIRLLLKI